MQKDIVNMNEKIENNKNTKEELKTMENNNVKISDEKNTAKMKKQKKPFTIMGLTIHRILAYFIVYSIVGYIIETIFGMVTKGVWESRQSFLYGPFCSIYGLGATIMIMFLHKYKKQYTKLFIGGFILGSIVEYLVSFFGEMMLHVKWWDYSNMPLNINGRICVYFSFFWGFLAIYLIASFNPNIDKLFNWIKTKISIKTLKTITVAITIFLFVDCVITGMAMRLFLIRTIAKNDINVPNKEAVINIYNEIYDNEKASNFIYKYWGDKKMIRTFPNIKVTDVDGNLVYMDMYLKDIQPYYLKIHEPLNKNK